LSQGNRPEGYDYTKYGGGGQLATSQRYGTDPANLGNMPAGDVGEALAGARAEGIIASLPHGNSLSQGNRPEGYDYTKYGGGGQLATSQRYSIDPTNLGNMPTGEPPQAVIASPPFVDAGTHQKSNEPDQRELELSKSRRTGKGGRIGLSQTTGYGESDGQLAAMREGDVDAVIASPPFADSQQSTDSDFELESTKVNPTPRKLADRSYFPAKMETDGQLAALPEGEPPQGIVSSPPHGHSCSYQQPGSGGEWWDLMRQGFNVSEIAEMRKRGDPRVLKTRKEAGYSRAMDNLGNQQGDTFWSAARAILQQCHVLAPGGVAIFVTKRFVRDGKIVEFSQQWADLCQSCGFELVEWIKAWLIEERGTQYDLMGEVHTKTVKRFSFFRRLHAQKYPHLAIEWEDVLIFRKGNAI